MDTFEAGFDSLPNDCIDGENGWTAVSAVGIIEDPADAGNIVMEIRNTTADTNYKIIPTMPDATNSTLYFRFRINGGAPDINVGASDSSVPDLTTEQRAVVRFNNTTLQVYTSTWVTLTNVSAGVWYQLWIIANSPSDNHYEVYIADDNSDTPVQLSAGSVTDWTFRNGGTGDLKTFFVNCNTGNAEAGDNTLIDDIYVDTDEKNLTDPRITATQPYLVYSKTLFSETVLNNGQLDGPHTVALINGSFYTNSPMQESTHYTVSTLPDGLTFSVDILSTNELSISFIGAAESHVAADNTSFTFTFLDAAFANSDAADVYASQQDFDILFDDPIPAGWQIIDNLETLGPLTNTISLDGTNGWTLDHLTSVALDDGTGNNVVQFRGPGVTTGSVTTANGCIAWKSSGTQHSGTNGTLFFRFQLQNTTSADLNIGLTGESSGKLPVLTPVDQALAFGPIVRIVDDSLQVLDDTRLTWVNIATNLSEGVWYKFWMTIDNPDDIWHAYIQGGSYSNRTQLGFDDGEGGLDTEFVFRTQTLDTHLINFMTRGNGANGWSTTVYLDDIFIDLKDVNFSIPPISSNSGTLILIF